MTISIRDKAEIKNKKKVYDATASKDSMVISLLYTHFLLELLSLPSIYATYAWCYRREQAKQKYENNIIKTTNTRLSE